MDSKWGMRMHVTAYDVGVMATKQLHCNALLQCLCTSKDDMVPSQWASEQNKMAPQW